MLYKNSILELEISDIDYEGLGISHYEEYTIFVRDALIGEKVKARIEKVGKNIAFAKAIFHIVKSPNRINPLCPYYVKCGGCNMMPWQGDDCPTPYLIYEYLDERDI